MKKIIVNRKFKGIEVLNGRYHYNGDLKIEAETVYIVEELVINGNLIVNGNLVACENLTVSGRVEVAGYFIACCDFAAGGDVTTGDKFHCEGNARIGGNVDAGYYINVHENLHVMGDVSAQDTSVINGWFKCKNARIIGSLIVDEMLQSGRISVTEYLCAEELFADDIDAKGVEIRKLGTIIK